MGATQPCYFKEKMNRNNNINIMRLDKITKNKTISNCKSNKIIIKIKKTYNRNFRISLPITKQKNTLNSLLTKMSLESNEKFKTIYNDEENDNKMRYSIIKRKSSHKSPIHIKRATIYNSETIKSVKNYMKGPLKDKERFCTVYSGLSINGEIVTIKEYNNLAEKQKKTIIENRENIYKLNHPNIIKVISLSNQYDEDFKIVYESLNFKNVEQHIKEFGTLNERMIKKFGKQLLKGLEYMHNKKVYHKNLNPSNILVDIDGTIKISGCLIDSLILGNGKEIFNRLLNSNYIDYYIPPFFIKKIYKGINEEKLFQDNSEEIILNELNNNYEDKIFEDWQSYDLWFVGCILIEALSGKKPWSHYNFKNKSDLINFLSTTNLIPTIPKKISLECKELIQTLLDPNLTKMKNIYNIIFDLNFFKLSPNKLRYQTTNVTNSFKKSYYENNDSNNNNNYTDSGTQLGKILEKNKVVNMLNANNNPSFTVSYTGEESSMGSILNSNLFSPNKTSKIFDFRNNIDIPLKRLKATNMPSVIELKNEQSPDDKINEPQPSKNFDFNDFSAFENEQK